MLDTLLKAAAIPAREGRYPRPPAETYAVYFDAVESDGPDGYNRIFTHDCTVELYAPAIDRESTAALERALEANGIHYTSQGWYWLSTIQRYQNIYEFTYITKS